MGRPARVVLAITLMMMLLSSGLGWTKSKKDSRSANLTLAEQLMPRISGSSNKSENLKSCVEISRDQTNWA